MHIPLMLYLKWLRNSCTQFFFGFTKQIKKPSEMNLALTISLSLLNTLLLLALGTQDSAERAI